MEANYADGWGEERNMYQQSSLRVLSIIERAAADLGIQNNVNPQCPAPIMKLVPVSLDDLQLFESCFCDPEHMSDLGGVQPREKIPSILAKQVSYVESDRGWVLKIVPDASDIPAGSNLSEADVLRGVGTVGLWEGEWKGNPVTEICWGVAPGFKGLKFGKKALHMLLDKAVADGRWGTIHVFTTVTNAASNALCVSCGFQLQGEETVDYDGRELHTNHYTYETVRTASA